MLKDKGTIRLRTVLSNNGIDGGEDLVLLDNLASTIRDLMPSVCTGNNDLLVHSNREPMVLSGQTNREGSGGTSGNSYRSTPVETSIECIYVQHDQFFDERMASKTDRTQSIKVTKTMRGITQRAEAFLNSMVNPENGPSSVLPVFAVTDISFWCLRDFGSRLMQTADRSSAQWSATQACQETIELHPNHKRSLKTLSSAIDSYLKRNTFAKGGSQQSAKHSHRSEVVFLLYSKIDDRFDMITLHS